MKKLLLVALFSGSLFASGASLYKACAGCHGAKGEKVALGKSKKIATLTKDEFVANMKGYKAGTFGGPMKGLMKGQAQKLSDADIVAIAEYVQSVK